MTGKYPARLHITDWITGSKRPYAKLAVPDWTMHLPLEEVTLAEALKSAGYATAHIGKWHLGNKEFWPEKQGFDKNIGGYHRGQPPGYFSPYNIPTLKDGPEGEYLTDREGEEASQFIEDNKDNPFFLYMAHYAVHRPLQAKETLVARYQNSIRPDMLHTNATYAAMIHSVDDSVNRILTTLKECGIANNTYIFFTGDNGGLSHIRGVRTGITDNSPLRLGKGSAYEGGVRVPFIVKGPDINKINKECHVPIITVDYFPTILELAEIKGSPEHKKEIDGESLVPLFKDPRASLTREAIYWHYPHYHPGGATPYSAVRKGFFKLIEFFEDGKLELYDLKNDIGETRDLSEDMPDTVTELYNMLKNWRKQVQAQLPIPNPDYDAAKDK